MESKPNHFYFLTLFVFFFSIGMLPWYAFLWIVAKHPEQIGTFFLVVSLLVSFSAYAQAKKRALDVQSDKSRDA